MNQFGNFGIGLGQSVPGGTMINPYFDLWGPFAAQQGMNVKGLVAYYPATMEDKKKKHHGMHGLGRGVVYGPVGTIPSGQRASGR